MKIPAIPPSIKDDFKSTKINKSGYWGIMSDTHFDHHDDVAIESFEKRCKRQGKRLAGIILNGDIMDACQISDHLRDPHGTTFYKERDITVEYLKRIRGLFPKAHIIYKEGNHEDRIYRYILRQAPSFHGLEELTIPSLLKLSQFGIDYVATDGLIELGKLNVIHGHEYQSGWNAPANPAKTLLDKANECVLAGHHHSTHNSTQPTIRGDKIAAWVTGCNCNLQPKWKRYNNWNLGHALVDLAEDGAFDVSNFYVRV